MNLVEFMTPARVSLNLDNVLWSPKSKVKNIPNPQILGFKGLYLTTFLATNSAPRNSDFNIHWVIFIDP